MKTIPFAFMAALLASCDASTPSPQSTQLPDEEEPDEEEDPVVDTDTDPADSGMTDSGTPDSGDPDPIPSHWSVGCGGDQALFEGEQTFVIEERERRYLLRFPEGYTQTQAWPLVLALHPNGSNASYWDVADGERDVSGAIDGQAILLLAEAIDGRWRDYDQPSEERLERVEIELRYFEAVLEQVKSGLCVNETQVFSMGFSGGGSFSGVLGCRREDIRAIAAGGSVMYFKESDCVGTPAAWIAISEGDMSEGRASYRDFFRVRAGCAETSRPTEPDTCVAYDSCAAETPVHSCHHPGGHIWPSFGTEAAWAFFQTFLEE